MYKIPHPVHLDRKSIRGAALLRGALALAFVFAFCYSVGEPEKDPLALLVLPLGAAWMTAGALVRLVRLRNRAPLLTLDGEGVRFSGRMFEPIGTVAWKDITVCMDMELGWNNERYLLIHVRNPEAYTGRIADGRLRSRFEKLSRRYNALLWIKTSILDEDVVELKRAIFRMKEPAKIL